MTALAAPVTLRAMRWWDIEPLHAMESELFPVDAWSTEQFWSELAGVRDTRWYVVAEDDDEVIGYAGLFVAGTDADVQTIAVSPAAQGRGIGRQLLAALIDEAERRGARRLFLEVRADNEAAIALYERHEFTSIARRRDYYAKGVDAIVMRRVHVDDAAGDDK